MGVAVAFFDKPDFSNANITATANALPRMHISSANSIKLKNMLLGSNINFYM
jgi:hypothetical protein